jgi:hypothetical protein
MSLFVPILQALLGGLLILFAMYGVWQGLGLKSHEPGHRPPPLSKHFWWWGNS